MGRKLPAFVAVRPCLVHERAVCCWSTPYPDWEKRPQWCAPGGGVEKAVLCLINLIREVYEETGRRIHVGTALSGQ